MLPAILGENFAFSSDSDLFLSMKNVLFFYLNRHNFVFYLVTLLEYSDMQLSYELPDNLRVTTLSDRVFICFDRLSALLFRTFYILDINALDILVFGYFLLTL